MKILRRLVRVFIRDRAGSADVHTYLLLTAAGCTMVGLTAPHLFNSSKTASDTFEQQVQILQRGAGGGTGIVGTGTWDLSGLGGLGSMASGLGVGKGSQLAIGNGPGVAGNGAGLAGNGAVTASAGNPAATNGNKTATSGNATATPNNPTVKR